jgi:hypothetical protein
LDCKGKNYISNKKAFAVFLAERITEKAKTTPKTA